MKTSLALAALLSSLAACAVVKLSPAEEAGLATAMRSPATFELGKDESLAAWGRAQIFLFKHSRIRTISDFVIDAGRVPHYTAERLPLDGERFRITLDREAYAQGPQTPAQQEQREQDLHVFAHFVRTGELACARDGVSACVSPQEAEWFGYTPFPFPVVTGH